MLQKMISLIMTGHCLLVVAKSLAMFSNTFGLVVSRFMSSYERFAACINFGSKLFDMDNNSNHAPSIKKPILVAQVILGGRRTY